MNIFAFRFSLFAFLLALSLSLYATEHSISLHRDNANVPISRGEIITVLEEEYEAARILSLQARPSYAAPDCHVASLLKPDGELIKVYVGC